MPGNKPATTTTNNSSNSTGTSANTSSGTTFGENSGSSFGTTSTSRNPWDPAIPALTNIINQAETLGGNVGNFTPQFSGMTLQGIDMLGRLASGPTAGNQALSNVVSGSTGTGFDTGMGTLVNTASGNMLNANSYLDPVIQKTLAETADRVNGQFTAAGRYGSGAHAGALAKQLGNIDANMRLSNYTTERAAQDAAARTLMSGGLQGAGFSGQLDQTAALPAQYALQAGQLQDQITNAQRQAPMNALSWQAGLINPIAGMGGTSTGMTNGTTNNTSTGTNNMTSSGSTTGTNTGTQTSKTVQPTNWLTTGLGLGMSALGALSGNPMALANLGSNMGGLLGGLGGSSGGGTVNGFANNDPYGTYSY